MEHLIKVKYTHSRRIYVLTENIRNYGEFAFSENKDTNYAVTKELCSYVCATTCARLRVRDYVCVTTCA